MMQIPSFPEANHPLVQALTHYSDLDLLTLFQRYPEQGKYFTVIFCRYSSVIYSLIDKATRSPVQADYIFALTWRHIFHEMRHLDLQNEMNSDAESLQNWLITTTTMCLKGTELPPVESIHYDIKDSPPPLWCYLEQSLELIPSLARIILVLADNFQWSETQIAAYLQGKGDNLTPTDVKYWLEYGHECVLSELPQDIREIYFPQMPDDQGECLKPV